MTIIYSPPQEKRRHYVSTGKVYYGPTRWAKIVTPAHVRADVRYFWLVVFFGAIAAVALGMLAAL
jgi:hypothetical protein